MVRSHGGLFLYKKEVKKEMEEEMPLKKEKDMVRIHTGAERKKKAQGGALYK